MEAIRVLTTRGDPDVLLDLLSTREESAHVPTYGEDDAASSSPLRHFFYDHLPLAPDADWIELGPTNDYEKTLRLGVLAFREETDDEGRTIQRPVEPDEMGDELQDLEFNIVIFLGEEYIRRVPLDFVDRSYRSYLSASRPWSKKQRRRTATARHQFVPPGPATNAELAHLWDGIRLTASSDHVIRAMQSIDARIQELAFVESHVRNHDRIPMVKLRGAREPLSLKSMGDGALRVFQLVLALVNSSRGTLLIDEFENGLHWSVQPEIWDLIFDLAEEFDVQVFATTHSRDCVWSFQKAWTKEPEKGRFMRLAANINETPTVTAYEYDISTLANAVKMDVEVR